MKKTWKTTVLLMLVLALSVGLFGCGKSKASKLLKTAEKASDFDKISTQQEFVENYEEFVNAGVEFFELYVEKTDNEDFQEISKDFLKLYGEWNTAFTTDFAGLSGGGAKQTLELQGEYYELSADFLEAYQKVAEAKEDGGGK